MRTGVYGADMRTLMRPGRRGVLVKIEARGQTRFLVGGEDLSDREIYLDWGAALQSFEAIELGVRARVTPASIVERVSRRLLRGAGPRLRAPWARPPAAGAASSAA